MTVSGELGYVDPDIGNVRQQDKLSVCMDLQYELDSKTRFPNDRFLIDKYLTSQEYAQAINESARKFNFIREFDHMADSFCAKHYDMIIDVVISLKKTESKGSKCLNNAGCFFGIILPGSLTVGAYGMGVLLTRGFLPFPYIASDDYVFYFGVNNNGVIKRYTLQETINVHAGFIFLPLVVSQWRNEKDFYAIIMGKLADQIFSKIKKEYHIR